MVPSSFEIEKYVLHYENLQLYLRLWLKLKNVHCVLEFNQLQWLKPYVEVNKQKIIDVKKKKKKKKENGGKDGKALYKLMNNDVYVKTMKMLCMWRLKKVTNRRDIKVVSNTKTKSSKPSCMPQKILDIDLVAIRQSKVKFLRFE